MSNDRILLTIPEVVERLALSRATVYKLIGRGELPVIHHGRAVRVHRDDLEEFAQRLRPTAPHPIVAFGDARRGAA